MIDSTETLKHIAGVLSREYKVSITIDPSTDVTPHYVKDTITIGTKSLGVRNLDFYVGAILHEIGHLRHSAKGGAGEGLPHAVYMRELHNLLEDQRVEAKMAAEYRGGDWYLSELNTPLLSMIAQKMSEPPPVIADTLSSIEISLKSRREECGLNALKYTTLQRTVSLAVLRAEGYATPRMTTGIAECDDTAKELAEIIQKAKNTSLSAADILPLVREAHALIAYILPDKAWYEQKVAQEAKQANTHAHMENIKRGMESLMGGMTPTEKGETRFKKGGRQWEKEDKAIIPLVSSLKRRLITQMRENARTRYVKHQRSGKIDKKGLHKVAAHTYRVYQRKLAPKGRKYAVSIVIDTSGSMWGGYPEQKYQHAMRSGALLARVLRGMGYPVGITLYGHEAYTILDPTARYIPRSIADTTQLLGTNVYRSGGNDTHIGIEEGLKRLNAVANGRHRLMIIITDGGLTPWDIDRSKIMLKREEARGNFSPVLFYVEAGSGRILADPTKEHTISSVGELIPAAVALLNKLNAPITP